MTWGMAGSGSLNPARAQLGSTPVPMSDTQGPAIGDNDALLSDGASRRSDAVGVRPLAAAVAEPGRPVGCDAGRLRAAYAGKPRPAL